MAEGVFIAVVGPSGAGKDTLLKQAAEALSHRPDIVFVRRVITRKPDGATEDHDTQTPEAFAEALENGAFCLSWRAHGLFYSLPTTALDAARRGKAVVANVSRGVLSQAQSTFGRLAVVEVTASDGILAARIAARGRESESDVRARLARSVELVIPADAVHVRIDNSGPIKPASAEFTNAVSSLCAYRDAISST